jgi:hypothetical protein
MESLRYECVRLSLSIFGPLSRQNPDHIRTVLRGKHLKWPSGALPESFSDLPSKKGSKEEISKTGRFSVDIAKMSAQS